VPKGLGRGFCKESLRFRTKRRLKEWYNRVRKRKEEN
jgi:hypothetical protein